jgi:multiple antibiotic resistance protein
MPDVPEASVILKMVVSLFAVVNPLGSAPLYLSMTANFTPAERGRIANTAAITCAITLCIAAVAGEQVLNAFGISVGSFRVIGGLMFLLMAIDMLNVRPSRLRHTPEEQMEAADRRQVAFVPLGIPMLAGPGAISTVLLYWNEQEAAAGKSAVIAVVLAIGLACWAILRGAAPIGRLLGTTGINILIRLMGLIVGALGVEYVVAGLKQMIPGLQ